MDQKEYNVDMILGFLTAYSKDHVKEAVTKWAKINVSNKLTEKEYQWKPLPEGQSNRDPAYDYATFNNVQYFRKHLEFTPMGEAPPSTEVPSEEIYGEKEDLSTTLSDLVCPFCSGETAKEPLCRGCVEAKAGMRYRYMCLDDDDHVFYTKLEEADAIKVVEDIYDEQNEVTVEDE